MINHGIVPQPGSKVRLIKLYDKFIEVPPGTTGKVSHIDSVGTIHVKWDNGVKLGLLPAFDLYEIEETHE